MRELLHFNAGRIKDLVKPLRAMTAKLHLVARRAELTGIYPDFDSALAAVPRWAVAGYNNKEIVDVAIEKMCRVIDWDYPVLFWLERELIARNGKKFTILDAGGHIGTKYRAFSTLMDLSAVAWQVYELPPIAEAGMTMARRDGLENRISFCTDAEQTKKADLLLCSGLLQYLDEPFPQFLARLPAMPEIIILNKVALRAGETIYSLQRAGPAYLPYQIRDRDEFLREVGDLGYDIVDAWRIQYLTHEIASHPEVGDSESWGFVLKNVKAS